MQSNLYLHWLITVYFSPNSKTETIAIPLKACCKLLRKLTLSSKMTTSDAPEEKAFNSIMGKGENTDNHNFLSNVFNPLED